MVLPSVKRLVLSMCLSSKRPLMLTMNAQNGRPRNSRRRRRLRSRPSPLALKRDTEGRWHRSPLAPRAGSTRSDADNRRAHATSAGCQDADAHRLDQRESLSGPSTVRSAKKGAQAKWNNRRVLIFTENREGTKRYLKNILEQAIEDSDGADERIEVIDGLTSGARRKEIQLRFNKDPAKDPLRILLATDAAREGLNFQAHCADLFHFDLPWNPGRIEQRNGRIDRKLQPADEVRCHYFVLPQRIEDRVLEILVRKTETIKKELGSLSKVIDDDIERRLSRGIRHNEAERLAKDIEAADLDADKKRVTDEELESTRARQEELEQQIMRCQTLLEHSRASVGFDSEPFREALSCSLELLGTQPLVEKEDEHGRAVYILPPLDGSVSTDPSWAATLDSLRVPRKSNQKVAEWRREAPIRPVVFEDTGVVSDETVHLHLEQRLAQRLLARFRSQGFIYHDLSRACLVQSADSIPRVILLGRLSLYGRGAERLHEEVVPLAARWVEPSQRRGPLAAYAHEAEAKTLNLLEQSLGPRRGRAPNPTIQQKLLAAAPRDIAELACHSSSPAQVSSRSKRRKGFDSAASTKRRICSRYLNGNVIVYATSSQDTRISDK